VTDSDLIEELRARLLRAVPPGSRVILHGARARAHRGPGPDFRILVIEPRITRLLEEAIRLRRELDGLCTPVDVVVMDEARARIRASIRGTTVERALRDGELLVRT
jgi:hypothetical protein